MTVLVKLPVSSDESLSCRLREDIIYLTADSDNCIHELDPSKVAQ